MAYLKASLLLVAVIASCSAVEYGNVIGFAPLKRHAYVFSNQQNDLRKPKYKKADFTVPIPGERVGFRVMCNRFLINMNTPDQIEQLRATIIVNNVELDSYDVLTCDPKIVQPAITLVVSSHSSNSYVFTGHFADKNRKCIQRTYELKWEFEDEASTLSFKINRSSADLVKTGIVSSYLGSSCNAILDKPLVNDWMEMGEYDELPIFEQDFQTVYALDGVLCPECYVMCRHDLVKDKFYTHIFINKVPVEKLTTSSCTDISLKISITLWKKEDVPTKRDKAYYMRFLGVDGYCKERKYLLDIQNSNNIMFQKAFLGRGKIEPVSCHVMIASGYLRYALLTVESEYRERIMAGLVEAFRRIGIEK